MEAIHSTLEYAHLNEMQDNLNRKLSESHRKDLGRLDSLRSAILSLVVGENYERAKDEMIAYVGLKTAFPLFQERAERYVQHCCELIKAIETKRKFPGLASLSLAKQQEVHEKVIEHFEELKHHLRQIEKVEREQKLSDVRSTVWVVRAFSHGVALIALVAFLIDVRNGTFSSFVSVTDSVVDTVSGFVVNLIKL